VVTYRKEGEDKHAQKTNAPVGKITRGKEQAYSGQKKRRSPGQKVGKKGGRRRKDSELCQKEWGGRTNTTNTRKKNG